MINIPGLWSRRQFCLITEFFKCLNLNLSDLIWDTDRCLDLSEPPLSSADPPPVALVPNEQQLTRLTDYVAFLEN